MSVSDIIHSRVRSIGFAVTGIGTMLRTQPNARIHLVATVLVVGAAAGLGVDASGWCWLVAAIAAVWMAEAFNTALEFLADAAQPDSHPLIKQAKDVAAAAVLIAALAAAVVGLAVFWPVVS